MVDTAVPTLDVVIVTWQHGDALARCLMSLAATARRGFSFDRIVVVDNASTPPPQGEYVPGLPPVSLIRNRTNRGFAAACNQGAADSRATYLLFLNPDTCVDQGAIAGAVHCLERSEEAGTGLLGLRLRDERGATQASCGRFPTARRVFHQVTGLSLLAPHWLPGMRMVEWDHAETRHVDFVCGACLFVRRALFEDLGGFDERLFVYLEDADLAQRARHRGWRAQFVAEHAVLHSGGWSSGRDLARRLAASWRSLIVYGRVHESRTGALAIAGTVLVLAPAARIGHALLRASGRELLAVVPACLSLWAWLGRHLVSVHAPWLVAWARPPGDRPKRTTSSDAAEGGGPSL